MNRLNLATLTLFEFEIFLIAFLRIQFQEKQTFVQKLYFSLINRSFSAFTYTSSFYILVPTYVFEFFHESFEFTNVHFF